MRWAILAASAAAACFTVGEAAFAGGAAPAGAPPAAPANAASPNAPAARAATPTAASERATAPQLRVTSPPSAAPDRTYNDTSDALLAADVDYLVHQARRQLATGDQTPIWTTLAFADDLASNQLQDAHAVLTNAPGGLQGNLSGMLEPFLLAAQGRPEQGAQRVDAGGDNLPAPLPDVQRALVYEGGGRLQDAARIYAGMLSKLDLTPPSQGEASSVDELQRQLAAPRVAHAVYRAALVNHRLHNAAEARRLYDIVVQFAPHSADVEENLRRLAAGQAPIEAPLDPKSACGHWMLFLSEYLTQAESLSSMLQQQDPSPGLPSSSGAALMQLGILLAPDANDWRLYAAQQLQQAGGLDGAERIIDLMPADSVFAPDADIERASILIDRKNTAGAVVAAQRAQAHANNRWAIVASAADIYRRSGQSAQALAAYDAALAMTQDHKDRADILGYRAYANRFAGNYTAATADMRQAYQLDQGVDTRLLYVSILMDDPAGWRDGVQVARGLFAEQPDSVLRINALGYALIQHPEGLEEGYRLLTRGYAFGPTDYAVIDSLAWAYYLYGYFDAARALDERANQLAVRDPNAEVLDHLGDIYWRLNRRDDARNSWTQALAADPDVPRQHALRDKLAHGLTAPAPRHRELPHVEVPNGPAQRQDL
jgi:tetratricopeptide (TPR) repeat protein